MKKALAAGLAVGIAAVSSVSAAATADGSAAAGDSGLRLATTWDKTFAQSDKVEHRKITFRNRYGITLAADLYRGLP
ncbi:hypothetical protein [uncultured Sutterella sp.]|uniref:hypothetical protein n=1 Tax=uncultured Sutterella sp. TaxID=286133 RepID=UPI00341FBAA2